MHYTAVHIYTAIPACTTIFLAVSWYHAIVAKASFIADRAVYIRKLHSEPGILVS